MNFLNKKTMIVISIVLLVVLIATIILAIKPAKEAYKSWRFNRTLHGFVDAMKKAEQDDYAAAMADTYGGKTPQETLQMYIDAVEKGDYELASRYFIGGKQGQELKSLKNSKLENIYNILSILKRIKIRDKNLFFLQMYEEQTASQKNFETKEQFIQRMQQIFKEETMTTKVNGYDFDVRFKQYPNGIWKMIRI